MEEFSTDQLLASYIANLVSPPLCILPGPHTTEDTHITVWPLTLTIHIKVLSELGRVGGKCVQGSLELSNNLTQKGLKTIYIYVTKLNLNIPNLTSSLTGPQNVCGPSNNREAWGMGSRNGKRKLSLVSLLKYIYLSTK